MKKVYEVVVPLVGCDTGFVVARCPEPEGAAEVVRVLLAHASHETVTVRVSVEIAPVPPF